MKGQAVGKVISVFKYLVGKNIDVTISMLQETDTVPDSN